MFNPESPPALSASRWFNTDGPKRGVDTKGKVALVAVFQMHCPACIKHGLPQAQRIAAGFNDDQVAVIGLHSVFEDHDKQTPEKLEPFIAERGFSFAIAVDDPSGVDNLPKTFAAYELQGTPTVLLFDRQGRLRRHYLGAVDDVRLSAEIMALTMEPADAPREVSLALERRLAIALVDPDAHQHAHDGGCCGGHGHDHSHDHAHSHDHGHHHHDNDDHSHAHKGAPKAAAKAGGCNDDGCGCKH